MRYEMEGYVHLARMIDKCRAVLAGTHPEVLAPPPIAIARTLLEAWVQGDD